jgi:nucleoside-diphosphate-sugar epimerase
MEAPEEKIKIRTSYNLGGISFTPKQLAATIKKHQPTFGIDYDPDYRQVIAESWPESIDDQQARDDWDWKECYDLNGMVEVMLKKVDPKLLF